jgi:GT2 family glycosyltransferase
MTEKISVILTVHNDADHIGKSIESILSQTHSNLELIVVDDGSTDGTADVVTGFSDRRLRLLRPGRVGRGKALNSAVAASNGELLAIEDSDDLSHPRRLEVQALSLRQNRIDFLGASAILFEDDDAPSWPMVHNDLPAPIDVTLDLTIANPIPHISLMMRRQVLQQIGAYNERRKVLFDYDLYIRAAAKGYHLYRLPISLAGKRIHANQQFEKGARARYVFEMLRLQSKAISALKTRRWLIPAFPLLFCYRMLPRGLRMGVQRRRPVYNARSAGP